jgi:hypothetical protein
MHGYASPNNRQKAQLPTHRQNNTSDTPLI